MDVVSAKEEGMLGRSDEEQPEHATKLGRTIYSLNVSDFVRIHSEYLASGKSHPGIIVIPMQRNDAGTKIQQLVEICTTRSPPELEGAIVFL